MSELKFIELAPNSNFYESESFLFTKSDLIYIAEGEELESKNLMNAANKHQSAILVDNLNIIYQYFAIDGTNDEWIFGIVIVPHARLILTPRLKELLMNKSPIKFNNK